MSSNDQQIPAITLIIINSEALSVGLSVTKTFNQSGGDIGSDAQCDWKLTSSKNEYIYPIHCSIEYIDGNFTIQDRCGATFANDSTLPVGLNRKAILTEKDTLKIGPYHIQVRFNHENKHDDVLFSVEQRLEQHFVLNDIDDSDALNDSEHTKQFLRDDPLQALDALKAKNALLKEVELAGHEHSAEEKDQCDVLYHRGGISDREINVKADSEYEIESALILKKQVKNKDHVMDDKKLALLEEELARNYLESDLSDDEGTFHLAATPMLKGLGVAVGNQQNTTEMHMLSEEFGRCLQATVKGLLSLHEDVQQSRFGVMNKNLQPIEDNPLRLGLSYEETMKTLFDAYRSPVHLSGPAAIEESLCNIKYHNLAIQHATRYALQQILHAFSPDVLMRRFMNYRRAAEPQAEDMASWSWSMYKSYYRELASDRQQGFEKLFWEIFDQAYDKRIREMQKGG